MSSNSASSSSIVGIAAPPTQENQGAVRHMDAAAGVILNALEELAIAEETLVLFTTDHGLALPRAKCSLCDPSLEVAAIVRSPAVMVARG